MLSLLSSNTKLPELDSTCGFGFAVPPEFFLSSVSHLLPLLFRKLALASLSRDEHGRLPCCLVRIPIRNVLDTRLARPPKVLLNIREGFRMRILFSNRVYRLQSELIAGHRYERTMLL